MPIAPRWIGLILNHKSDGSVSYSWYHDYGDHINYDVIASSWCDGYPITANKNITSYTYLLNNCWMNVFNTTDVTNAYCCGPPTDQSLECWIAYDILPLLLFIIGLPYAIHIVWNLWRNLYKKEHNWIQPPSNTVKLSAISFGICILVIIISGVLYFGLIGIAYFKYGIVFNAMLGDCAADVFPEIYNVAYVCLALCLIGAGFAYFLGYLHILFRLHHFSNNNGSMPSIMPCKYCLHVIGFMICLLLGFIGIALSLTNYIDGLANNRNKYIVAIAYLCSDYIFINVVLLYYYVKGLKVHARLRYFGIKQLNMKLLDDRIHESLVEATRYVVLFGMVFLSDILFGSVAFTVCMMIDTQPCSAGLPIAWVVLFIEMVIFTSSIYLSFKFNHERYEKWCKKCDKGIKYYLERKERRQQRNLIENDSYTELASNIN